METAARIISSPALRFSGTGDGVRSSLKLPSRRPGNFRVCFGEFSDSGHMQYYQSSVVRSEMKQKEKIKVIETENKTKKMKMKLIKRLSKDLNLFSQTVEKQELGSRLIGEVKGKMMSEAAEVLLAELENLRTEKKEQKRKRKDEKAKLMKSKAMINSESSSSSSSSESSDSDNGGNPAIDMRVLRNNNNEAEQGGLGEIRTEETKTEPRDETISTTTSSFDNLQQLSSISTESVSNTKIEICMGGKCKKLGAPMLMEEFEKKIGTEGSVVGCKCMGKCKSAPNVRVCNSLSEVQEESVKCSVQTPTNPLYIGVGLEDVGVIVANLLSQNWDDSCLPAAC